MEYIRLEIKEERTGSKKERKGYASFKLTIEEATNALQQVNTSSIKIEGDTASDNCVVIFTLQEKEFQRIEKSIKVECNALLRQINPKQVNSRVASGFKDTTKIWSFIDTKHLQSHVIYEILKQYNNGLTKSDDPTKKEKAKGDLPDSNNAPNNTCDGKTEGAIEEPTEEKPTVNAAESEKVGKQDERKTEPKTEVTTINEEQIIVEKSDAETVLNILRASYTYEREIQELKDQIEEKEAEINGLKEANEEEIDEPKVHERITEKVHKEEIKKLEKAHEEEIKKLEKAHKEEIKKLEKAHEEDKKNALKDLADKKDKEIKAAKDERDKIAKKKDKHYKEIIDGLEEKLRQERADRAADQRLKATEIATAVNAEIKKAQRYYDNVGFADELKPYAEKVLVLMDMGNKIQAQCNNLYMRGKDNANAAFLLNNAFAKFHSATINLKSGNWNEQLNALVYNGTLIKPPAGKENNHSSVYATIRQAIKEGKNPQERAAEFQKAIAIAFLNRYCSALLVLIEDMQVLFESKILPQNSDIQTFRNDLRTHIKKDLGLEINDVLLLASSQNNSGIQIMEKVPTNLTKEENRVIEILSYGIERKGTSVEKTKVIISK